jgi:hypothetical protein
MKRTDTIAAFPTTNDISMPLQNLSHTADPLPTTERKESSRLNLMSETRFEGSSGWAERLESMIERYPWPTVLLALALGYAISRRLR